MYVEGCGRLSVHDGLVDVACGFGFVCTSWVVRWRGMNVSWVLWLVGESASALGDIVIFVEVV